MTDHSAPVDAEPHDGSIRCLHCGVHIIHVELLVGGMQWQHELRNGVRFLHCHRWPYPLAEPEPWTLVAAGVGDQNGGNP